MHLFPVLYLAGCVLVWILGAFEREDSDFSPSMLLLSILIGALVLRLLIRSQS